jgi:NAD(P) transhydrogenase subunit alpha
VLAIYVGYHVVWNVTPALHTPLMAVTNAISAIVIVGAMLAAALTVTPLGKTMGTLAVALAAVNVFGGFLVTRACWRCSRRKPRKQKKRRRSNEHESGNDAVPDRVDLLHPGAQGPVAPTTSRRGNLFGMIGMAMAILTTVGLIYKLGANSPPRASAM